ncbi:hypothetical protein CLUP02_11078 [Colletotrichum lupini]|uniref:Uncharacterized protein n=1 Tax=Colletotrichum lupini TaxID=145971 RepID=A0A9Q8SXZ1_9PEZI|nr:hypothetical protein CLUP02_11078 [Colletotrichum lupini]
MKYGLREDSDRMSIDDVKLNL